MTELATMKEREGVNSTDDPKKFIADFLNSQFFKYAYESFYNGKRLAPDVTEEEKIQVFLESDSAKVAPIGFAEKEEMFTYNPAKFSPAVQMAARTCIRSVEDFLRMYKEGNLTREEIKSMDNLRFSYHRLLAETLHKEGFVPSIKIGRGLARLFLIDKGLDTFDSASVRDGDRLSYLLGY